MIIKVKNISMFESRDFATLITISDELFRRKSIYTVQDKLVEIAREVVKNYDNLVMLQTKDEKVIVYELEYFDDGLKYSLEKVFEENKTTYVELKEIR